MSLGPLHLHVLDVGQGEAILIDLPDGAFGLVDGGPWADARGIIHHIDERIDQGRLFAFAAITHRDHDHIAGLPTLLRRHRPAMVLQSNIHPDHLEAVALALEDRKSARVSRELDAVLDDLACGDTMVKRLGAGDRVLDLPGVELAALAPDHASEADLREAIGEGGSSRPRMAEALRRKRNATSLVLWLRAYERNLLLPGEIDPGQAERLHHAFGTKIGRIPCLDPRVGWFKLPHHGSETAGAPQIVQYMAATPFVASAAHGGRFGHPHPKVLAQLRADGGTPMCTQLGRGCHLALTDPRYPIAEVDRWTGDSAWKDHSAPRRPCYGKLSVTVWPDGRMEVKGGQPGPVACAFGGPSEPLITL